MTLIQMKVTPVSSVYSAFGGDKHREPGLGAETAPDRFGHGHDGVILMARLAAAGLAVAMFVGAALA